MNEKRILILSEAFGAGHTKVAEALREGLLLLQPNWSVHVCELGTLLHPMISEWIISLYMKTLRYSPKLWGMMYKKAQPYPINPKLSFLLQHILYTQLAHTLNKYQPHLIICTHPFPSAAISQLKRAGLSTPLYTVITDYVVHGAWISSGVDRYYVPSVQLKEQMKHFNVPTERIEATGIPVSPKFWQKKDKKKIRQQLGLTNLPTILCMGGGMGIGLSTMLQTLYQFRQELQILFITGKNTNLYKKIKGDKYFWHPNFHLYGFVDNIDELMDAANLLITKPGGVTCAEAIAKQIPIVLLTPIPGQEEDNFRFILDQKLGVPVANEQELEQLLTYLISSPALLRSTIGNVATPTSGQKIIEQIITNLLLDIHS